VSQKSRMVLINFVVNQCLIILRFFQQLYMYKKFMTFNIGISLQCSDFHYYYYYYYVYCMFAADHDDNNNNIYCLRYRRASTDNDFYYFYYFLILILYSFNILIDSVYLSISVSLSPSVKPHACSTS